MLLQQDVSYEQRIYCEEMMSNQKATRGCGTSV